LGHVCALEGIAGGLSKIVLKNNHLKRLFKHYLEAREQLKEQSKKVLNNTEEFCTVNHGETFVLA
jgi:hypothetical protein